ncbi:hypothetical protein ACX6XY_27225 [Streptomyces sp. O3]
MTVLTAIEAALEIPIRWREHGDDWLLGGVSDRAGGTNAILFALGLHADVSTIEARSLREQAGRVSRERAACSLGEWMKCSGRGGTVMIAYGALWLTEAVIGGMPGSAGTSSLSAQDAGQLGSVSRGATVRRKERSVRALNIRSVQGLNGD